MESEQIMSEAITRVVAEATRIAIQTVVEAQAERTHNTSGPKIGGPTMKQPIFNWNAQDKHSKLKTFRLEVNNDLSIYNTPETDKLAVVKNWLGRKGLQYLETSTTAEKETYNSLEGLFKTLSNKFKPQYMRQLSHYNIESYTDMMRKM